MSQNPITGMRGLATSVNQLQAQPGYLQRADNCVIRQRGIIEPRRGQPYFPATTAALAATFGTGAERMAALFAWSDTVVGQYGSKLAYLSSGGAWTEYSGSYSPPDSTLMRMKFAIAAQRLYFTTSSGLYRNLTLSSTPAAAGVPFGHWHYHLSRCDTISGGFLAEDRAVAYRHLFKLTDSNGREIVGPASEKLIIVNPPAATIAIGALTRSLGILVTGTTSAAHRFKQGDQPTLSPGEANFATGVKTITLEVSATSIIYSEAGANVSNTVQQTLGYGASRVLVRILLPTGLSTSHVVQLYRSEVASAATITPSEEMGLVYEAQLTSTDISNGYVDIYDNTPDVMLGPTGYFCPSQSGLENNHDAPLIAKEVATLGGVLLAGNLTDRHRLEIDLLAAGTGTNQLTFNDVLLFTRGSSSFTVTLGGSCQFTAGNALAQVFVDASSVANSIERTALSIATAINGAIDNTFLRAQYISGVEDSPGMILLEARDFSTTAFTVTCALRPNAWNPTLPSSPVATSVQGSYPGRLAWSLPDEPDAMPGLNFQDVGNGGEKLLRIIPQRDKAIIIKERSFWLLSGSYPNFRFDLLDDTVRTIAPDTASSLNGQVMVLTAQGVAQVTDGGVGLLSLPCEDDFLELLGSPLSAVRVLSWGCSRESEHQWLLGLPQLSTDATATLIWVWNSMAREWTQWPVSRTCACVEPTTDALYLGDSLYGLTRKERKNYSADDQADEDLPVSYLSGTGTTVTLVDVTGIAAGDYLVGVDSAGHALRSPITAVSSASGAQTVTVATSEAWAAGSYTVAKAINHVVEWLPMAHGAPASGKQNQEAILHFREECFRAATVSVASDISPAMVAAKTLARPGWGLFDFGAGPFGVPTGPRNERALVPLEQQRAAYETIRFEAREAFARWRLQGITPLFEGGSERTKR